MNTHDLPASVLPFSIESEIGVLGSLLLSPDRFDSVSDILEPKHFHDSRHGAIYSVIASLVMSNKSVDVLTVFDRMQTTGTASEIELSYLAEIAQFSGSASTVRRYAEIVAERAMMRGLIEASDKARTLATETGLSAADRLDQCQDLFQQLQLKRGRNDPKKVGELTAGLIDRLQELADGRRLPGVATRLPTLDRLLGGGMKPGKQIVLAARPSIGKTALALEFAKAFALEGYPAAILSMEMENSELIERLTANIGGVDLDHLTTGKLENDEWSSLSLAVETLAQLPIYTDDQPALTLGDIQAKARKLKRERDIKLLVIDYLQLCGSSDKRTNSSRHHQIEEISRGTKALAKQLGLTVVLLSQLSRDVDKRPNGKPNLSDLKESGSIEEDADTVILLSMDHVREGGVTVIHADVAKNRGGKKGYLKLAFRGTHQRFVETIETKEHKSQATAAYTEDM
jgi:replicative DNA helicase